MLTFWFATLKLTVNNVFDAFTIFDVTANKAQFKVKSNVQTIIGAQTQSTDPHTNAMLTINGKIMSKSCYIRIADWADYVFAKDYKITSLKEVEAYYKVNKHLPEIPTAIEVEKEGLDLGAINTLLVKKVEELTIYAVEQSKTTEAQQALLVELQKQVEALKKQIEKK